MLTVTYRNHREVLGDDILQTLEVARSLAVSLRRAGRLDESRDLTLQAHYRCLARYGPASPETAACALNTACDSAACGDLGRAITITEDVMAGFRKTWARPIRVPW